MTGLVKALMAACGAPNRLLKFAALVMAAVGGLSRIGVSLTTWFTRACPEQVPSVLTSVQSLPPLDVSRKRSAGAVSGETRE